MSVAELTSLLTASGVILSAIGSIGALVLGIRNGEQIHQVHLTINSEFHRSKQEHGEAEHAKGVIEGVAQGREAGEAEATEREIARSHQPRDPAAAIDGQDKETP